MRRSFTSYIVWRCFIVLQSAAPLMGYIKVPPPDKVALPSSLSAMESLAAIQVPQGMQVELVAAEPVVRDPIDVAWGPDGRMWVVEMADYPLGMDGKGKAGGRIVTLESTKGDGRYDKSTIFATDLRFPTSVIAWRKGILVTTVPDVLYLEDTDGDGRSDIRTVVFSGLGEGNQQHLTNGLQWGLDGWLYMGNGGTRGTVTSPNPAWFWIPAGGTCGLSRTKVSPSRKRDGLNMAGIATIGETGLAEIIPTRCGITPWRITIFAEILTSPRPMRSSWFPRSPAPPGYIRSARPWPASTARTDSIISPPPAE